jgi:hypothetical protein
MAVVWLFSFIGSDACLQCSGYLHFNVTDPPVYSNNPSTSTRAYKIHPQSLSLCSEKYTGLYADVTALTEQKKNVNEPT